MLALVAAVLLAVGCSSRSLTNAPVEDRGGGMSRPAPVAADAPIVKPLAGAENAGKSGYYTVKPGDTMIRIGLDNGQNWRDIARWNGLENPNLIEVGQVLRVLPPASDVSQVVARPVLPGAVVAAPVQPASAARPGVTGASASPGAVLAPAPGPSAAPSRASDEDVDWIWPAKGTVISRFDAATNKGIDIEGSAGDAVVASADGSVVYVGAALRGYGNLIILKHGKTFMTAYAHNKTLLVKDDQIVKKGQKIAEMGNSDSEKVQLHFEIRRQGKPVDPAKYLPPK